MLATSTTSATDTVKGKACSGLVRKCLSHLRRSKVDLCVFDKKLRLLTLDALERIEAALRVDISHALGREDRFACLRPELFHKSFSVDLEDDGVTKPHRCLVTHAGLITRYKAAVGRGDAPSCEFVAKGRRRLRHLAFDRTIVLMDKGMSGAMGQNSEPTVPSTYDHQFVEDILGAMIDQWDFGNRNALPAQHLKCAPIVRQFGTEKSVKTLDLLECKMRETGLLA